MASFDLPDKESHVPNREELLQMATRAAKAGNREGARVMFRKVVSEDPRNERALMWLAKLAGTKAERKQWLNRVLIVNPDNHTARQALQRMAYKRSAKENRVLLIFGVVVAVLVVLGIVILVVALTSR